jgi:hypothetical protein
MELSATQLSLRTDAIAEGRVERCQCCGAVLDMSKAVYLHLDLKLGTYHRTDATPSGESQGWFPFGRLCAKAVMSNGGMIRSTVRKLHR